MTQWTPNDPELRERWIEIFSDSTASQRLSVLTEKVLDEMYGGGTPETISKVIHEGLREYQADILMVGEHYDEICAWWSNQVDGLKGELVEQRGRANAAEALLNDIRIKTWKFWTARR